MITHFLNPEIRGQGHLTNTWPTMFGSRCPHKSVCSFASNWFITCLFCTWSYSIYPSGDTFATTEFYRIFVLNHQTHDIHVKNAMSMPCQCHVNDLSVPKKKNIQKRLLLRPVSAAFPLDLSEPNATGIQVPSAKSPRCFHERRQCAQPPESKRTVKPH